MKNLLLILLLCTLSAVVTCQTVERLDSLFTTLANRGQFHGTVLVAERGNTLYEFSYGPGNKPGYAYTLGSVAKTLTATAVLQLTEKGLIQLDAPVTRYLPGFPYPAITIRHLLTHTSGLPDYNLYGEAMKEQPDKVFDNTDIIPSLAKWKPALPFQPGDKWQYSNTNYSLLALLVSKVSGISFETYLQDHIFSPANMRSTRFQALGRKTGMNASGPPTTMNYEYPFLFSTKTELADSLKKNRWRAYNMSGFVGQGNLLTTTAGMIAFDRALYNGILLQPATLEMAFTPATLNNGQMLLAQSSIGISSYGLGWFIMMDSTKGKIVWHSGGVPGGLSVFLRNLSTRQTVIAFDNHFGQNLYRHGMNAMNIIMHQPLFNRKISLVRHYAMALEAKGPEYALEVLNRLRTDTATYILDEDDMNELGLQLLYAAEYKQHIDHALAVLKQNTDWFPQGYNTWDSYGEALAFTGNIKEAIVMYKRSIALNPKNESGKKSLEKLMKM